MSKKDAGALERAAHKLKGAVSIFDARGAVAATRQLEALGRAGDIGGAPEVLRTLEEELDRLTPQLTIFSANGSGATS